MCKPVPCRGMAGDACTNQANFSEGDVSYPLPQHSQLLTGKAYCLRNNLPQKVRRPSAKAPHLLLALLLFFCLLLCQLGNLFLQGVGEAVTSGVVLMSAREQRDMSQQQSAPIAMNQAAEVLLLLRFDAVASWFRSNSSFSLWSRTQPLASQGKKQSALCSKR